VSTVRIGPPWLLVLALALLGARVARADPLYVIEQLVVSVSSAPDASGERIATLKSGDKVELIEREGDQVHVKLANGKDGWVRSSYLTGEEPLRARLAQREGEIAQLKDEVGRLQGELRAHPTATAPGDAVPGGAAPGKAPAAAPAVAPGEDPAPPAGGMFTPDVEAHPHGLWPWTLAAALLGLGVGFAVGLLVLDRHIRRKYGGLRIY
jgi:hypothetical protein